MPRPRPRCGTLGGYHAHRRHGEQQCALCLEAQMVSSLNWNLTRNRALKRLIAEYRPRYVELVAEERAALIAEQAPEDLGEARAYLQYFCHAGDAEAWLDAPQEALGGKTSREAITEGRISKVFGLIAGLEESMSQGN